MHLLLVVGKKEQFFGALQQMDSSAIFGTKTCFPGLQNVYAFWTHFLRKATGHISRGISGPILMIKGSSKKVTHGASALSKSGIFLKLFSPLPGFIS